MSAAHSTVILGFDPGTAVTGWAALSTGRTLALLDCGAIRARATLPIEARLRLIHEGAVDKIKRFSPTVIAIEDPFVGKNPAGALTLGQARGVILLAAGQAGIRVASYPPATIKQSVVGRGSADKEQVRAMLVRLLQLDRPPEPLDASDAVAVALCHLNRGQGAIAAAAEGQGDGEGIDRARQLAARPEDAEALSRWLRGGKG